MSFITQHGRALLFTAVVVGTFCVLGCGGGSKPSGLVGHWVHYDGSSGPVNEDIELFKDGTGVLDNGSITWKVENKRLVFLSALEGLSCNYNVSGNELILIDDDGDSSIFVKKEHFKKHFEEYKKKKEEKEAEQIRRREEENKKEAERIRKEEEQRIGNLSSYFTDSRDGQKYRSVKIDGKTWMAENLRFKIGDSWCYDNSDDNCNKYGRLYNWNMAKIACPKGWHLPSNEEWTELVTVVGSEIGSMTLKSANAWNGNGNGTDEFGFSALPSGYRGSNGSFYDLGMYSRWWTATENGSGRAYRRYISYGENYVGKGDNSKGDGNSVRCLQD
jgi:uncharacterized protein (TIGR02145 family)